MTLPIFSPGQDPGAELHRAAAPATVTNRCCATPAQWRSPTARPSSPSATPTAWSWPATGGPPRATPSPTAPWRRSSRPTATPAWPSPAPPARRSRWSALPDRARALREGRGHRPQPRGQGQPARPDDPPATCPMAMQGLAVVPLFAGYDLRRRSRAASSSTTSPAAATRRPTSTPPAPAAATPGTTIKLGYREGLDRAAAIELAVQGLYEAADEDSATGGPDVVRGIYPTVATITADGFERVEDDRGGRALPARSSQRKTGRQGTSQPMSHAVLRRARAGDEGPGRLRPEGHRPGPAAGRPQLRRRHPALRREPVEHPAQGQRDLRPHRLRRCRQVQRVRPAAHGRRPPRRPQGLPYTREDVDARSAGQRLRPDPRPDLHPRDEADRGRDPRGRGRRTTGRRPAVPHPLRRHRRRRGRLHRPRRRGRGHRRAPAGPASTTTSTSAAPCEAAVAALAGPERAWRRRTSRSPSSTAHRPPGLPPHRRATSWPPYC